MTCPSNATCMSCMSLHIFVYFKIAEAAVSYFLKKLTTVDFVLKEEEQLAAVNSSLLYSINCTINITRHKSIVILHADLDSNSSFMEPEWGFLHVSSIIYLLFAHAIFTRLSFGLMPPSNFQSLGMRLVDNMHM